MSHGAALGPVAQPHQLFSTFAVPPLVANPLNVPAVFDAIREKLKLRTFAVVELPRKIAPPVVVALLVTKLALFIVLVALP